MNAKKGHMWFRGLTLVVVCIFLAETISWTHPTSNGSSKTCLAARSRIDEDEFREMFVAGRFLLAHKAAKEYIRQWAAKNRPTAKRLYIGKDITVSSNLLNQAWKTDLTYFNVVDVPGLLSHTGQPAHVGLRGRDYDGIPVVYIDTLLLKDDRMAVLRHELDEIIQWEYHRLHSLGNIPRANIRTWILNNIGEAKRLAEEFHNRACLLTNVYEGVYGKVDFDYGYINTLLNIYGWDSDDNDINIAAHASNGKKHKSSEASRRKMRRRRAAARDGGKKDRGAPRKKREKEAGKRPRLLVKAIALLGIIGVLVSVIVLTFTVLDTGTKQNGPRSAITQKAPGMAERKVFMLGQEHMDPELQNIIGRYIYLKEGLESGPDSSYNKDWRQGLRKILEDKEVKRVLRVYKEDVAKIGEIINNRSNNIRCLGSENSHQYVIELQERAKRGEFNDFVASLKKRGVPNPEKMARTLLLCTQGPVAYMVLTGAPALEGVAPVGLDDESLKEQTMILARKLQLTNIELHKIADDSERVDRFHKEFENIGRKGRAISREEAKRLLEIFDKPKEQALAALLIRYLNDLVKTGNVRSGVFADRIATVNGNTVVWMGWAHISGTKKALKKHPQQLFKLIEVPGRVIKGVSIEEVKSVVERDGENIERDEVKREFEILRQTLDDTVLEANQSIHNLARALGVENAHLLDAIKRAKKDLLEEQSKPLKEFPEIVRDLDHYALGIGTDEYLAFGQGLFAVLRDRPYLRAEFMLHEALCYHLSGTYAYEDGHQIARKIQQIFFPMNYGKIATLEGDNHPELTGELSLEFREFIRKGSFPEIFPDLVDIDDIRGFLYAMAQDKETRGMVYEITYNQERLEQYRHNESLPKDCSPEALLVEYVTEVLGRKLGDPEKIKLVPCRGEARSLITVKSFNTSHDRANGVAIGKVHLDIAGDYDGQLLRIVEMVNMGLVASTIPNNLVPAEYSRYESRISYVRRLFRDIMEGDISLGDMLQGSNGRRLISFSRITPHSKDELRCYYELNILHFRKFA